MSANSWWKINSTVYGEFCTSENSEQVLMKYLKADAVNDNQRAMVVFEYIFGVLNFCSEGKYTYEKAIALINIHKKIFNQFILGSGEGTTEEAVSLFKMDIRANGLFDLESSAKAAQYFASALLRNFDAYVNMLDF